MGYLHSSVITSCSATVWVQGVLVVGGSSSHNSTCFSSGNAGPEALQGEPGLLYLGMSKGQNGQDVQAISITLPGTNQVLLDRNFRWALQSIVI